MTAAAYLRCLMGIVRREALRFVHQRGRFLSALVRPLVWLAIFAAGFRFVLGVSISPPYETYVLYDTYIVPGLAGMILLFQGMQGSLSMVYDREVGSMRVLPTSTPASSLQNSSHQRGSGLVSSTRMLPTSRSYTMDKLLCMPWNNRIMPIRPGAM